MFKAAAYLLLLQVAFGQEAAPRETAALIVGGYVANRPSMPVINSTELFGCAGANGQSISLSPFPTGVYLTGGAYSDRNGNKPFVGVCGGYNCANNVCGLTPFCWTWTPEENKWNMVPYNLSEPRYAHIVTTKADALGRVVPLVVGYQLFTEIFNLDTLSWDRHNPLMERLFSMDCIVDYGDKLYAIHANVTELDIKTWEFTHINTPPIPLQSPQRCSALTIDGHRGIYIRFGYWLNLTSRAWVKKEQPPFNPITLNPNAIWSFRGRPTIFGNPDCDAEANCPFTQVISYDSATDTWIPLGKMTESRRFHEVIEVPGEFCDYFVDPPPSGVAGLKMETLFLLATMILSLLSSQF